MNFNNPDPWFVLGVTRGCSDGEIMDAWRDRTSELEKERAESGDYDFEPGNIWDQSTDVLNAARRQLLGH